MKGGGVYLTKTRSTQGRQKHAKGMSNTARKIGNNITPSGHKRHTGESQAKQGGKQCGI